MSVQLRREVSVQLRAHFCLYPPPSLPPESRNQFIQQCRTYRKDSVSAIKESHLLQTRDSRAALRRDVIEMRIDYEAAY